RLVLATLVGVRGSSYRRPGARMLISSDGAFSGSLSAGCIGDEVVCFAREVLGGGKPELISFDTPRRVCCNGSIEIFLEPLLPELMRNLRAQLSARRSCQVATVFEKSDLLGSRIATEFVAPGAFAQTIEPTLRLFIVGLGADATALRKQANLVGWETLM